MRMLTKDQKIILAQMIFNERELLFGDCGPNLSKVEKQEKWIEIFIKLNGMGANIPDYKTLRDIEWSNMRRAAEKKLVHIKENELKPSEERINLRPLTHLDEIVLDILGKGNGSTNKSEVEIPENASMIDPSFMASRVKYEEDDEEDRLNEENEESLAHLDDYDPRPGMMTRKRKRKRGMNAGTNAANEKAAATAAAAAAAATQASNQMRPQSPGINFLSSGNQELVELQKKKLRLEITKLELEIEKLPLECAKLELEIQKLQRDLLNG